MLSDPLEKIVRLERLQDVIIDLQLFDLIMAFRHYCCCECNNWNIIDP